MANIEEIKKENLFDYDIKIAFLNDFKKKNTSDSYINNFIYLFTSICPAEKLYNKDFMDFTISEIKNTFEMIGATRKNTFLSCRTNLWTYAKWCQERGYSIYKTEHPVASIQPSDLSNNIKFDKEYFKDQESFFDFVEELFPVDYGTTTRIFQAKLYLYLCWYGFNSEEIFNLKPQNIDFDNRVIDSPVCAYRVENVPIQVIRLLISCIDRLENYSNKFSNYSNIMATKEIDNLFTHPDGVNIFKRRNSLIYSEQKKLIKLSSANFGKEVKPKSIEESGKFYRLYQYEKNNNLIGEIVKPTKANQYEYVLNILRGRNATVLYSIYLSWLDYFYEQ